MVKFHWKPVAGTHSLVWEESQKLGGIDPDFHRRDLWDAIEAGAYPQWELGVQIFDDTEDQTFEGIDLLDPTKLVPEELARSGSSGDSRSTPTPPTTSPRPSRSRSTPVTSCRASTSPTIRCCTPASSPTSTRSSPVSAAPTSLSCRSTGRSPT